jgi:PqqD family protein of HPr-rel-A system
MNIKKSLAISDTGFVFDPSTGDSYTLNPTALEIIQLLKQNHSPEQITQVITKKYDVDESTFERYFYDFTGMLKQMQLVAPDEK